MHLYINNRKAMRTQTWLAPSEGDEGVFTPAPLMNDHKAVHTEYGLYIKKNQRDKTISPSAGTDQYASPSRIDVDITRRRPSWSCLAREAILIVQEAICVIVHSKGHACVLNVHHLESERSTVFRCIY